MRKIIALLLILALVLPSVPAWAEGSDIKLYPYAASTTLPQIYIETENGIALDDASLIDPNRRAGTRSHLPVYNYANATVSVKNGAGYELKDAYAQVRIRGNFTSSVPKHPLRIKFDEKHPMCGLNGGHAMKSWVLLSEYSDASLLRNSAALYIANSLYSTTGNYASGFRNVELTINGKYCGVYLLAEQQQVNRWRVDLPEPKVESTDVHTGYFIEYDGYYFNEDAAKTFAIRYDKVRRPNGKRFLPTSVGNGRKDKDDPSVRRGYGGVGGYGIGDTRETGFTIVSTIYGKEQRDFIQHVMQTVWDVLYDAVYTDHSDLTAHPFYTMDADGNAVADPSLTTVYDAVAAVVDIDSLIDMYIIQELAQDGDLDWSSRYFSIDMSPTGDHRLVYTAPWDFDGAFKGNIDRLYVMNADNPWFVLFCGQDWFWQRLNARWDEAREAGVFTGVLEMLDVMTEKNADAYARNSARWRRGSRDKKTLTQPQAAAELRDWLKAKIDSVDRLIDEMAAQAK